MLLPYRFQVAGWIIIGLSFIIVICGTLFSIKPPVESDVVVVGASILFIGLFLIGLSREKQEDEFTIFLRTRSALTAVVIMFGLNILFVIVFSALAGAAPYSEVVHDNVFNSQSFADFFNGFRRHTGYGDAFILYLILYKIRLAIYKRGARDEE